MSIKILSTHGWRGHQVLQLEVEDAPKPWVHRVRSQAACPAGYRQLAGWLTRLGRDVLLQAAGNVVLQLLCTRRGSCSLRGSAAEGARCGVRTLLSGNLINLLPLQSWLLGVPGAATDHLPALPLHLTEAEEPH